MNFWTIFFSISLAFWTVAGSYWFTCDSQQLCGGWENEAKVTKPNEALPPQTAPLIIRYRGNVLMSAAEDLQTSFSTNHLSLSEPSFFLLDSLRRFLANNPNKQLQVVGYYEPGETNSTTFTNLGLARANTFSSILFPGGLTDQRVQLLGEERQNLAGGKTSFSGGIGLTITDWTEPAKPTDAEAEMKVLQTSQLVYFRPASSEMITTDEQRAYFELLKAYLAAYPNSSITLTGHTDSQGNAKRNQLLGLRRAGAVRQQLIDELGFNPNQVKVLSSGDTKPLASNDTAEGRYQNRRVEIFFSQ